MSLCEIYSDVECLGIDECLSDGICMDLECDGEDCKYYDREHGCIRMNSCKKEK